MKAIIIFIVLALMLVSIIVKASKLISESKKAHHC
ncbi:hypothetical protein CLV25_102151 [Acetobacteroides hydrogenigenes]|uniref:Uncharacterized protein n=1 Tax=Acetobacteroides hydrogenigenes TaxID=979970 RepID=A0A4R2ESH0_9BACT|nr:hypothetical protein CLV25_102151 [Acetobacteroides hydrogenigenes]